MAVSNKPFTTKGIKVVSPKGSALWCKITEPERTFNAKGTYATEIVVDPNDPTVIAFVDKLEALRDEAYNEAKTNLKPAQAAKLAKKDVFTEEVDSDGNLTGNIKFKFKLDNVDDKEVGRNKVQVYDSGAGKARPELIKDVPLIGNGSIIKCGAYANPYYMANGNVIGISMMWQTMQLLNLVEYGGNSDFESEEDGYVSSPSKTKEDNDFEVEEGDDY